MKNINWKKWGMFAVAVIGTLFAIKLVKSYLLPKAPAKVQEVANKVLPST